MEQLIAGCCQFHVLPGAISANSDKVKRELAELSSQNCRLAVLPEMWSCGFSYDLLRDFAENTPSVLEELASMAAEYGMVVVGSLPEAWEGSVYNTSYVIDANGEIAGKYRKVHLFSLYREHLHFGRGVSPLLCETSAGKLGVIICYDLRFPELARRLAADGAEILCVSAQWPAARIDHWTLLLRARAVENQLFAIGCNGCGADETITWGGHSAIVSPFGAMLAGPATREETITATLDPEEIENFRNLIPCFQDRVPEVYEARNGKDEA